MFNGIEGSKTGAAPVTGAVESLQIGSLEDLASQPQTTPVPPTRFGMVPVMLPKIPDATPVILKFPNEEKPKYVVYLHDAIPFDQKMAIDVVNILMNACAETTVTFLLSSPGGSLDVGCQIAAAMAVTKAHTITKAIGWCCSASALIWTYGKEKCIEPGGYVMFHMSSYVDGGNAEDIRRTAVDSIAYVREIALVPLIAQGIVTDDEIKDLVEKRVDVHIDAKTFAARMQKVREANNANQ